MKEFSIGQISTRRVSKQELIEIIEKNFPDDFGGIAAIVETQTQTDEGKCRTQTIAFGKILDIW